MSGPLLVEVIRGGRVESLHEVDAVLLDASGRIVEAWGDATRTVMPSASASEASVLAVPITMQCPELRSMQLWSSAHSSSVIWPARSS